MAGAIAAAALLGAMIGSFLTVVAARLPRGESIVAPGSACPSCGHALRWRENVPVGTAAMFGGVVAARGFDADLALELPFAAMLIAVAAIDLEHRIVPNRIVVPAAVYAVAACAVVQPGELPEHLIAGAAAFGALLLAALAYPAGMGMGDVKLAGTMGLFLGSSVAPALLVAFLAGTVVGLAIIAREGASARKRGVPFAPFLAFGGLAGLLAGPELVSLYLDHIVK